MSVHSRGAAAAVLDALDAFPHAGIPVLHWFSGSLPEVDRALAVGCWFSVGPAMTRSKKGRAIVGRIPPHRVLTETDGPFARVGGSPLFPWGVERSWPALAEAWQVPLEEVQARVLSNLRALLTQDRPAQGQRRSSGHHRGHSGRDT